MLNNLTLIRGLPGSGKSTLARYLVAENGIDGGFGTVVHLETDMYFMDKSGNYVYDSSKAKAAHDWCFETTKILLNNNIGVIVSNTFTQKKEMKRYVEDLADVYYDCTILSLHNEWENQHNVPGDILKKMAERWEERPYPKHQLDLSDYLYHDDFYFSEEFDPEDYKYG